MVLALLVADLIGTAALALVGRRNRRAWTGVAVAGLVLGMCSSMIPVTADAGVLTTVVLVSIHVISALLWFAVLMSLLPRR